VSFPVKINFSLSTSNGHSNKILTLHGGLTVILGPNGSGKTHLLRGLKNALHAEVSGKHVRFLSAGRMGLLEMFRSDYDGQRGGTPRYEQASYGSQNDAQRRHQTETLNGDFQTLSQRADILIKVQERLRKLFKRDLIIDWDAGMLKVTFARLDMSSAPYSSGREASGLLHLVGMLSALYDDEVGALLIDEPEVSLHPQLQAFLLKEVLNVAGHPSGAENKKIVIIATHSTEMIKLEKTTDLPSLVFCYDLDSNPVQISPDAGELQNRKIQGLIARLGQEHKLSLFSKRPMLVEGPSDMMICSALASKAEMHLEASGSQLLPVIGKGQMPVVVKLLRLLGKEPVALADADAITDELDLINCFLANSETADIEASNLGFVSATQMARGIHSDFCHLASQKWDFISTYAEKHPYWVNKGNENLELTKRRATFCTLYNLDEGTLLNIDSNGEWSKIKSRLSVLLGLLEKLGCFILRKGSIESYYQKADRLTSIEKPSAAAEEVEHISTLTAESINDIYSDVVRCISYAANMETICEAEALRDMLLAVSAPALAKLQAGGGTQDIQILLRSLLGDRSNIFGFEVLNDALIITMKSKILNVSGFPLTLNKGDDVVKKVNTALKINS
jgi:energy-coupling factor transporter ATP-binding protein EcfA2